MADIKVGDWITQYSKGYFKVVDIKDGYGSDVGPYTDRKGELIGRFVICKKAFTPKMKPSVMLDWVAEAWCKVVDGQTLEEIEKYFSEHKDFKKKFESKECTLNPSIESWWIALTDVQAEKVEGLLKELQPPFTRGQVKDKLGEFFKCVCNPPANYILQMTAFPWELDGEYNQLCREVKLVKFS